MTYPIFDRRQHEQVTKLLSDLRASRRKVEQMCQEAAGLPLAQPPESVLDLLNHATQELERGVSAFEADLSALAAQRDVKAADYRRFKLDHGIERDAITPDLFTTGVIATVAGLAEALMTAGLMTADGKMDMPTGLIYGASFASLNIACGKFAGYVPGRWLSYRANAPEELPGDRFKRALGWAGLAGISSVMSLLGFLAARVRATGDHSNLWDFSEVGLAQTASDYFAAGLLVTAALGGAIAFMKGRSGIKDPVIGFSEIHAQATSEIAKDAEDFYERRLDALDAVFEMAMDRLENVAVLAEDDEKARRKAGRDVTDTASAHNDNVEAAKERVRRMALEARQKYETVHKKSVSAVRLDLGAFDSQIVKLPAAPDTDRAANDRIDAADLVMRLQGTYDRASASVEAAYTRFRAGVTKFDLNNHEGD